MVVDLEMIEGKENIIDTGKTQDIPNIREALIDSTYLAKPYEIMPGVEFLRDEDSIEIITLAEAELMLEQKKYVDFYLCCRNGETAIRPLITPHLLSLKYSYIKHGDVPGKIRVVIPESLLNSDVVSYSSTGFIFSYDDYYTCGFYRGMVTYEGMAYYACLVNGKDPFGHETILCIPIACLGNPEELITRNEEEEHFIHRMAREWAMKDLAEELVPISA